jgi:hypothetical protein
MASYFTGTDGILEGAYANHPLVDRNAYVDITYVSGQEYFVRVDALGGWTDGNIAYEHYRINTNNTVTEIVNPTSGIVASIPSSGTFRCTVTDAANRLVYSILMFRIDW